MTPQNSEAPVLDTYQAVVSAYSDFLTVAIHTILYERNIYPQTTFLKARKYNYPVRQSRHPRVCKWIQDAVAAVEAEMLKCTIATTSLIIHSPPPHCQPLERYVFSTASFPQIPASETLTPFAPTPSTSTDDPPAGQRPPEVPAFQPPPPASNLPEQFRATLSRLTTSLTRLTPLPTDGDCSFTVAIELREDSEEGGRVVDPPIGREEDKRWIVAEPGWQRQRQRQGNDDRGGVGVGGGGGAGKYLGGARTTPVRKVEAGAFAMECWVEEGRGKFRAGVEDGDDDDDDDEAGGDGDV